MTRKDFDNPIRQQIIGLTALAAEQLELCFLPKKIQGVMSIEEMFDFRKIIITGCGDSLAAAGITAAILDKYSDTFGCTVVDPIEFTRFTPKENIGMGEPNSPLFIAISANGNTSRIAEALKKATEIGAFTILITNNDKGICSKYAKKTYLLQTPKMENDIPGMRSYIASIIGVIALSCRLGLVRGTLPPTATEDFKKAINEYIHLYDDILDEIDEQIFELAKAFKDYESFNFIGDGTEGYSALFGAEKFYECRGNLSTFSDSEQFCQSDILLKDPQKIGTVFFADKASESFSRILEAIDAACNIKRPVIVITNAEKSLFNKAASICVLPAAKKEYSWLYPIMNVIPVALLAGYCGALASRSIFNMDDKSKNYLSADNMTINSSEIKIYM